MNSSKKEKNQQIQVFARVRPVNKQEKDARSHVVVEVPNDKEVNVKLQPNEKLSKKFTFDKVFGPNSKQLDVYSAVVKPLVAEVLAGYNCTVFAYGQTGTGKTFTMAGGAGELNSSWHSDPDVGIIPRALSQLFDELRISQMEHTVRVSYLELYNEELFDLLSLTDDSKIRLYEDSTKKGSVIVHGLEEVTVHTKSEVFKILEKGSQKRQTATTLMNAQSSRSHTVFSITVHIKEANMEGGDDLLKTGKLNLVDLAGSENIGRSGAVDKRAREAGNINQSLLTLGRVITALVERAPHIPYRESKLTRLLQESLGGRTKTSIIATVSPAHCNLEETLSTLEYAYRAKNITNRPEINQKFTKTALLKQYTEQIESLKRDLEANRRKEGFYLDYENYEHMMRDQEDKVYQINALKEELERAENICQQLNVDLMKEKQKLEMTTEKLTETSTALTNTVKKLSLTKMECKEKQHLIQKHCETEQKLGTQAKTLLSVADTLSNDTTKLHDSLFRRKMVEENNVDKALKFHNDFQSGVENIFERVEKFVVDNKTSNETISLQIANAFKSVDSHLNEMHRVVNDTVTPAFDQIAVLLQSIDGQTTSLNDISKEIRDLTQDSIKEKLQSVQNFLSNNLKSAFESFVKNTEERVTRYTTVLSDFNHHIHKNTNNLYRYADDMRADFTSFKQLIDDNYIVEETRLTELDDDISRIEEMIGLLKNKTAAVLENRKTFKEDFSEKMNMKISDTDEFVQDYYNFKIGFKNSMNAHIEQLMSGERKLQEAEPKIINETVKACEDVAHVIEINNIIASKADCYDTKTSNFAGNLKESLKRQQETIESLPRTHGKIVENARVADEVFESELKANVLQQIETNEHFATSVSQDLTDNTDRVHNYITKDFVKYTPSGLTPDKRQLNYPQFLAATSPHSRILERYRASFQNDTDEELEVIPISVPLVAAVEVVDLTNTPNCQLVKSASVNDIVTLTSADDNTKENTSNSEILKSKFELQRSATETKIGSGPESKLPRSRAALRVKNE